MIVNIYRRLGVSKADKTWLHGTSDRRQRTTDRSVVDTQTPGTHSLYGRCLCTGMCVQDVGLRLLYLADLLSLYEPTGNLDSFLCHSFLSVFSFGNRALESEVLTIWNALPWHHQSNSLSLLIVDISWRWLLTIITIIIIITFIIVVTVVVSYAMIDVHCAWTSKAPAVFSQFDKWT